MSSEPHVPIVFISYSHDNKEHKQWVLEIAQRLRKEGIEVAIDQWDLDYGDDVAKFMELWVEKADRVLMICTEPYVQKVDEGKGGAGYEAMIVTQELIRNLGTKKFVPVIRQSKEPVLLPKCIGTRMGVNFSTYADAESEFKSLIAQLHQLPPATKPPLGTGPTSYSSPLPSIPIVGLNSFSQDPTIAYDQALALARSGDLVTWRRLIAVQRGAVTAPLAAWREQVSNSGPILKTQLPDLIRGALTAYQPLFAAVVAGIESNESKFNQQGSLVYDLMEPKDWQRGGLTVIVNLPDTAAWVFHSLVGAMCVHTSQMSVALEIATQRVKERYSSTSQPLFLSHDLTGWPESLETACIPAWTLLLDLAKHFPWIVKAFGTEEVYRECLCGYYLTLSWLEYVDFLAAGKANELAGTEIRPNVPTIFLRNPEHDKGMRKVLEDREPFLQYSQKRGVAATLEIEAWPNWVSGNLKWLGRLFHYPFYRDENHEIAHFVEDLHR